MYAAPQPIVIRTIAIIIHMVAKTERAPKNRTATPSNATHNALVTTSINVKPLLDRCMVCSRTSAQVTSCDLNVAHNP